MEVEVVRRLFTVQEYHQMAEAGIPEVWIVDVNRKRLEVYRQPDEDRYQSVSSRRYGDRYTTSPKRACARFDRLSGFYRTGDAGF